MAFLEVNPAYRDVLDQLGLTDPDAFLAVNGVIVVGHPDRHVVRVTIGQGADAIVAFLKKEHRVPWKERVASAWAGFGFISKSGREARVLQALDATAIAAPKFLAAGEDGRGRAFVLVREVRQGIDLCRFLHRRCRSPRRRRRFMRALGKALAQLHEHGFQHPDLYAKHVLVQSHTKQISFLDWQRARRRARLTCRQRGRDLAALHATLADSLASPRHRLACLRAYCRWTAMFTDARSRERLLRSIRHETEALLRKRRIRELREAPIELRSPGVIWVEGEALCLTDEWHTSLKGELPAALRWTRRGSGHADLIVRTRVALRRGRQARLVRHWSSGFWRWFWDGIRFQSQPNPEMAQARLLFRLQRFGIGSRRLLAFGQRRPRPWQTDSFVLVEPQPASVSLDDWLAERGGRTQWSAERKTRWRVIRAAGRTLRRIHATGCRLGARAGSSQDFPLCVYRRADGRLAVGLESVTDLQAESWRRKPSAVEDLRLLRCSARCSRSQTDELRCFLAYFGTKRLTSEAKRLAQEVAHSSTKAQRRRVGP